MPFAHQRYSHRAVGHEDVELEAPSAWTTWLSPSIELPTNVTPALHRVKLLAQDSTARYEF